MSKKTQVIELPERYRDPIDAVERAAVKLVAGQMTRYPYDDRTTELCAMLRTMRPAGSAMEQEFVAQWIEPLGAEPDGYGNYWLVIGDSPILWSCHTDTVHRRGGVQHVQFQDGCVFATSSDCLGADDTVGVWLMRQMILAGVAGTYVFHRAEEIGGKGSSWVARMRPDQLEGIAFAIAFDRKGYTDIITDQMGDTASKRFAASLADALAPLEYSSARGIFTDTQCYSGIIPECSNISVGYHEQHTSDEWLDVDFAMRLLDRLVSADFSQLVVARDPAEYGRDDRYYDYRIDDEIWNSGMSMDDFCRQYPDVVSDFLTSCGFNVADLRDYGGIA